MKRKDRCKILLGLSDSLIRTLAKKVCEKHVVQEIEAPSHSLVMIKKRESSKNSVFYLSEILVSECRVMINDVMGLGILAGMDLKKAKYLAIIDAAFNANLKITEKIEKTLENEKLKQDKEERIKSKMVLDTRVSFNTMNEMED